MTSIIAGLVLGVYQAFFAISLVSLVFTGSLSADLPLGIGLVLVGAAMLSISLAILSSISGVVNSIQDSSTVLLAVITSSLVASVASDQALPTILVTIALSTLLTGLFLYGLGTLRLGELSRYIPYPVIGGFLAGTGWLLFQGTISSLTGFPFSISNLQVLFQPEQLIVWLPSLLYGVLMFYAMAKIKHPLIMPFLIVGGIILFYLLLALTGTSLEQASEMGLLLGKSAEATWRPLLPATILAADWQAILSQAGNIAVLCGITLIGLLFNLSALEVSVRQEFDVNHELRITGLSLVLVGLLGGLIGYHGLGATRLNYSLGSKGRLAGILAGLICLLIALIGGPMLSLFPRPIIGGMLFLLAYDFLNQWVFTGWRRFSVVEYGIILLIGIVIALTNFLTGVAVGLVAAVIMFVISYSRTNVIHNEYSGDEIQSNVERSPDQRRYLAQQGGRIFLLELQGFIFFGTANTLLEHIKKHLNNPKLSPVAYILLDFRLVTGLDSSAGLSFYKLEQLAQSKSIVLILTHTDRQEREYLKDGGLSLQGPSVLLFPDLDHGLEWCEDQMLAGAGLPRSIQPVSIIERLLSSGLEKEYAERLVALLEPINLNTGDVLVRQGGASEDMFFIADGEISIYIDLEEGERLRLSTMSCGTFVGEMGFYLNTTRSAWAIADRPVLAYRLTKTALEGIQQNDPRLASGFHQLIARQLAERLAQADRGLQALRS